MARREVETSKTALASEKVRGCPLQYGYRPLHYPCGMAQTPISWQCTSGVRVIPRQSTDGLHRVVVQAAVVSQASLREESTARELQRRDDSERRLTREAQVSETFALVAIRVTHRCWFVEAVG